MLLKVLNLSCHILIFGKDNKGNLLFKSFVNNFKNTCKIFPS